ncbi:hypothetical protein SAY86_016534 [Trapa natans]|uniref:RNase H type-1 domain-containing protein n=1 Tax=Trapa natans TaxID=22666 RepID=A0AAN7QX95_TRANT|nr:hypothetical protein SAY86_016534 [Trapa natans]
MCTYFPELFFFVSDDAVMVQQDNQAISHVGKVLSKEVEPPSVDIGTFNSSVKEKSKDKVLAIPTIRGYLHKSKYSLSSYQNLSTEPAPDDLAFNSIRSYSHAPSSDASWRGRFKLSIKDAVPEYYGPFLAYSPARAVLKAFEFSGLIPTDLHVELIPQSQLLIHTKFFEGGPNFDDIGLFFFADFESDSGCMSYDCLTKLMKTQDCAIRGSIVDDVDILIFTSNHLPLHTHWLKNDLFLCGVFYVAKKDSALLNLPEEIEVKDSSIEHLIEGGEDTLGEFDENPSTKRGGLVEWTPPSPGWVKLNSSAVSRGGRVGIGGSVHGPSEKWIFGYVQNLGQCNCTQLRADLWALLLGLKLLFARGYSKVFVETDSEQALECLKTDPDESDPNADFIVACRKILLDDWLISRSVVSVEKNWPAVMIVENFEDHPLREETILHSPLIN